jgi:hypothetical protein
VEVIFRIPSKVVQYGYAEVKFDHQPGGSAEEMGKEYLAWVSKFQSAELAELEADKSSDVKAPASKPEPVDEAGSMLTTELDAKKIGASSHEPWDKEAPATDKPWEKNAPKAPVYEPDGELPNFDW